MIASRHGEKLSLLPRARRRARGRCRSARPGCRAPRSRRTARARRLPSRCAATSSSSSIGGAPRSAACSRACASRMAIEQRLLLAGRAFRRRHAGARRGARRNRRDAARPWWCRSRHRRAAPRRGAGAARPRRRAPASPRASPRPCRRAPAARPGRARASRRQTAIEPRRHLAPRRRDGDAVLGHVLLERGEPGRVGRAVAQQPGALAHRLLIGADARRMRRVEAETSRSRKRRRAELPSTNSRSICGVSQTRLRCSAKRRLALAPARRRCAAGGARRCRSWRRGRCRSAPALAASPRWRRPPRRPAACRWACAGGTRRSISAELRAAQAAAGREERDRLEQIGLARAVRPGQHHRPLVHRKAERGIAAKIGEHETRHGGAGRAAAPAAASALRLTPCRLYGDLRPCSASIRAGNGRLVAHSQTRIGMST